MGNQLCDVNGCLYEPLAYLSAEVIDGYIRSDETRGLAGESLDGRKLPLALLRYPGGSRRRD